MDFGRRKEWLLSELSRYEDDYPSWTTMPGKCVSKHQLTVSFSWMNSADASLCSLDPFQHNHPFDFRSRDGNSFAWRFTSEDHFPPGVEPKMHHNDFNVSFDDPKPRRLTCQQAAFVGFEIESLSHNTANGACNFFLTRKERG